MATLNIADVCKTLGRGRESNQTFGSQRGLPGHLASGSVSAFERHYGLQGGGLDTNGYQLVAATIHEDRLRAEERYPL
jgi:hypothetical protein